MGCPIRQQLSRRAIRANWFSKLITMRPLQRLITDWIAWCAILMFRPCCSCLARFSRVEVLPLASPSCVERQTALLPVIPRYDFPGSRRSRMTDIALKEHRCPDVPPASLQPSNAFTGRMH